ncbi:MAG: bifunctional riboflavin kinase/FAD synthetase [Lachnospiraceae bacterium]|nr:bifunctional riboflavin kinase/FAD synthetase [Lachnospiraceae bacterium]
MIILANTTDIHINGPSAVAIGKFDGVHKGHQMLLEQVIKYKEKGYQAVAFTFDPSPAVFFSGGKEKVLLTREEKREWLESMGIDVLIEYPMNRNTADILPEIFIKEVLVERLHTKVLVAGEDISYGKKGAGDLSLLQSLSKEFGYEVNVIEKMRYDEKIISSTLIRDSVLEGDMEYVGRLLGTPYSLRGVVSHGSNKGTGFHMPTANLIPSEDKLLPPFGVYFSKVRVDGCEYAAITNIGMKPTVSDKPVVGVETFLYNYSGDLYGKKIEVYMLQFLRPEQKFETVELLIRQLEQDKRKGQEYHFGGRY